MYNPTEHCYYADLDGCECFPEFPKLTFVQCNLCKKVQHDPNYPQLLHKILDTQINSRRI